MNTEMLGPIKAMLNSGSISDLIREHPIGVTALGGGLAAAVGSTIDQDNPGRGALIGGGVAAAGMGALKAKAIWGNIGPIGRIATLGLATVGVAAGAYALSDKDKDSVQDIATPDLPGEYGAVAASGVRDRLAVINASGGITLGLHRSR